MTLRAKRERVTTVVHPSSTDFIDKKEMIVLPDYAHIAPRYRALKTITIDEANDIGGADSDKFSAIIHQVDGLHELVRNPREQVIDADVLLGITNSLAMCVKAQANGGITPSDFVNCLLRDYVNGGERCTSISTQDARETMNWRNIGVTVSDVFKTCSGCHTMLGPMNTKFKMRKTTTRKRIKQPMESSQPEKVDGLEEKRTDTDINMATMFTILRKNRSVRLEHLVLNRNSFAQTVENLFTLSFLVKDGRAEIKVDENGWHLVSPRNAASASEVAKGAVVYRHFVFRFDYKDWKLMAAFVSTGEELMPHRGRTNPSHDNQEEEEPDTPIRKCLRNSGSLVPEEKNTSINARAGSADIQRKLKIELS
ncbi:non-structural maintenance of chromosomes element 4 homolog A-like [Mercurialis annua]|uniref:non-structural maintenance of chromosomes element 4 homolog A-like n=1 Tax=Mercurialis annua TaxID=3986 RepID=UPI00215F00DB|nr:non-structural maintenance of chromosomes element 4 homolog A-like [Mercurialis annua]